MPAAGTGGETDMSTALEFDAVSFAYSRDLILREVSLTVTKGEMVGVLGPNGAGKSTLLKLAAAALRPERGRVLVHGDDVRHQSRTAVARQIAVVPQDFDVQFSYTVRQIVELGRTPYLGAWGVAGKMDRAAVQSALDETGTSALAERVFNELSGGERQRVLVALALAQDAGIVLLDEPTAHLDIKHQIEVLDLLRQLNQERGITIVAVLHDLNLAARYFPRLVLYKRGVVADGSPAQVLRGELLSAVYETPVQVGILRGAEHLSVLPPGYARANDQRAAGEETHRASAHVVAGGGSGELLMRSLADARIVFTAGPLNVGDSDYELAQRLAMLTLAEPPYAPISSQGVSSARERMLAAQAVVICPAPLGPGNVALLEMALETLLAGVPVILLEMGTETAGTTMPHMPQQQELVPRLLATVDSRDFSGRGADLYRRLLESGATVAAAPAEVVAKLQRADAAPNGSALSRQSWTSSETSDGSACR